ncbi:hypothetical protein I4674_14420 [Proteus mirabilis]|nr:hypothetical protein [Proteus mirabilis]
MTGYEAITKDRKIQINDRLETMCVVRENIGNEHWLVKDETANYVRIHAFGKNWFVAPISEVQIPKNGVGFEIYNENGKCTFSSLAKVVTFVKKYNVNMDTVGKGKIILDGKPGHRYGYIPLRSMGYIWNRNIRMYVDPITYDEMWECDQYYEGYNLTNDNGNLTFEYSYEFGAHVDWYTSPPPDREGSGLMEQGWMIDASMLED